MTETVVIKNVTDVNAPKSFSVDIDGDSSVGQLKELLQATYAGSPTVSSQRLICKGQVLRDKQIVKDILATAAHPYTFYLIVVNAGQTRASSGTMSSAPQPFQSTARTAASTEHMGTRPSPVIAPGAPPQQAAMGQRDEDRAFPGGEPGMAQWNGADHGAMEGAPVEGGEPWVPGVRLVFHVQWSLVFKLAFVVFLLSQNSSYKRVFLLGTIAVLIYLWQENRFGFLMQRFSNVVPSLASRLRVRGPGEDPQSDEHRPASWLGYYSLLVYLFFYGFIRSLIPSWKPILLMPHPPVSRNEADALPPPREEEHPHAD